MISAVIPVINNSCFLWSHRVLIVSRAFIHVAVWKIPFSHALNNVQQSGRKCLILRRLHRYPLIS